MPKNLKPCISRDNTYVPEEYLKYFAQEDLRKTRIADLKLDPNHLHMLPLGGVGEIGMNCMIYHTNNQYIMVDCGNTFDRVYSHAAHVVVPCIEFAMQRPVSAILLTHGHEDHIGALPYLWPKLKLPIYGTKFTNILVRRKLEEAGFDTDCLVDVETRRWYEFGDFQAQWIDVCHSIPGAAMIAIRTKHGSILHTGDWKVDSKPALNEHTDFEAIKALAQDDLKAIVSDSTNIMIDGYNPTEEEVGESLSNLIQTIKTGKIFVTFFSTNISRLNSCIQAAKASGRKIAIIGRALQRAYEAGIEAGYVVHEPHVLLEDFSDIPSDELLIACSGSQGEARSALTRIAKGTHRQIRMHEKDTVIFSCRMIPTNAKEVTNLENALIRAGVNVITNDDHLVHSSGHAKKQEFEEFYELIKANAKHKIYSIPVHGTSMFLRKHAAYAKAWGMESFDAGQIFGDGKVCQISPTLKLLDYIEHTAQFIDGKQLISIRSPVINERKVLQDGVISIVAVVTDGRHINYLHVCSYGIVEDRVSFDSQIREQIQAIFQAPINTSLNRAIRHRINNFMKDVYDKQICIQLHIVNSHQLRRR